jgi:Uma2 family endonuclease
MSLELEDAPILDVTETPTEPVEEDRKGHELVDGVWVEKEMSNWSAVVEGNLASPLKAHIRTHELGSFFLSDGRYQMFADRPDLIRKPDMSFVRFGRFPGGTIPRQRMELAPDLAVEVISPTDLADNVQTKLDEYLRAGVRLSWFVYIPTRTVWAYKPDGTAKVYRATDALPGEDVLPGFTVPVAELFEGL